MSYEQFYTQSFQNVNMAQLCYVHEFLLVRIISIHLGENPEDDRDKK
jgi:hypothetical protein